MLALARVGRDLRADTQEGESDQFMRIMRNANVRSFLVGSNSSSADAL